MNRFSEVNYNSQSQTVDIGSGLYWDDVYKALDPHAVNVVGGRVAGVGVAGFSLGGGRCAFDSRCSMHDSSVLTSGYSWLTNQYGLTIDNIVAFELVLPDGSVVVVNDCTPDLFFALKVSLLHYRITRTISDVASREDTIIL